MAKRVSARRIKANLLYTYEEAAEAAGVTMQTISAWRKQGLKVYAEKRPYRVLGDDLKGFIQRRSDGGRCALAEDQFYCMRCKTPRTALGGMADYIVTAPGKGRLEALCEACEGRCVRFVSAPKVARLRGKLDIAERSG